MTTLISFRTAINRVDVIELIGKLARSGTWVACAARFHEAPPRQHAQRLVFCFLQELLLSRELRAETAAEADRAVSGSRAVPAVARRRRDLLRSCTAAADRSLVRAAR